jgi:hypothetical protein
VKDFIADRCRRCLINRPLPSAESRGNLASGSRLGLVEKCVLIASVKSHMLDKLTQLINALHGLIDALAGYDPMFIVALLLCLIGLLHVAKN